MNESSSTRRKNRALRTLVLAFAACAPFAAPLAAHAQDGSAAIDLAVTSDDDRWALVPTARAAYRLNRRWQVRGEWGCVEAIYSSEAENGWSRFEAGNLFVGADARGSADAFVWSLGAGVTAPTARLDGVHDPHGRTALGDATTAQALWDLWLWAPDRLGFVLPASAFLEGAAYRLGLDAAAALLVPARQMVGSGNDVLVQARAVAAAHDSNFEAGATLQAVVVATQPSGELQVGVAPYARLQLGSFWLGLRYLYAINQPLADRSSIHVELGLGGRDAR